MTEPTNTNRDRKNRRKPPLELNNLVFGKVPPQSRELEEAVLGAIMLEKSAFDTVVEILKPECFYTDAHQRIFMAMMSLCCWYGSIVGTSDFWASLPFASRVFSERVSST